MKNIKYFCLIILLLLSLSLTSCSDKPILDDKPGDVIEPSDPSKPGDPSEPSEPDEPGKVELSDWQYDEHFHWQENINTGEKVNYNNHNFYQIEEVDGDCLNNGKIVEKCDECGYVKETIIDTSNEHDYSSLSYITAEGDDVSLGHYLICDVCGKKSDIISHNLAIVKEVVATCTEGGYHIYKCSDCSYEEKKYYSNKVAHTLCIPEIIIKPTNEKEGKAITKCDYCSYSEEIVLPTLDKWECYQIQVGYCNVVGINEYDISINFGNYTNYKLTYREEIGYGDHEYATYGPSKGYQKDIIPTYDSEGRLVRYCIRCKEPDYLTIPTLNDSSYYFYNTIDATCIEEGHSYATYQNDGITIDFGNVIIPALGHDYHDEVIAPTCLDKGFTTHICNRCLNKYISDYIEPLGHDFSDIEVVQVATCTSGGINKKVCKNCGLEEEIYTKTLEHNFVDGICINCNYNYDTSSNLLYEISEDKTYYIVSGININDELTDNISLVIPNVYEGEYGILPVKEIKAKAFNNELLKEKINNIILEEGIIKIGNSAFSNLDYVNEIILPLSLKNIEEHAFYNTYPKKLTLGGDLISVGNTAFSTNYTNEIYINSSLSDFLNIDFVNGSIFNSSADVYLAGKIITDLTIGSDVKIIKPYTLEGIRLDTLHITSDLIKISNNAFSNSFINKIIIDNIGQLEPLAFFGIYNLYELEINGNLDNLDENINFPTSITKLTLPNVPEMPKGILADLSNLEDLTLPYIGKSINNTSSVKDANLGYLFIDESKEYDDKYYYKNVDKSDWSSIDVPDYYLPKSLYRLTVLGGALEGKHVAGAYRLSFLTIGANVTDLDEWEVTLQCGSLVQIHFKKGFLLKSIIDFKMQCTPTIEIVYESGNEFDCQYNVINNIEDSKITIIDDFIFYDNTNANHDLFSYDGYLLVGYIGIAKTLNLPELDFNYGIGYSAFYRNDYIVEVNIPNCVDFMDLYNFFDYDALLNVTIDANITELNSCFVDCQSLNSIKLDENIKTIYNSFRKGNLDELDLTNLKEINYSFGNNFYVNNLYVSNIDLLVLDTKINVSNLYFDGTLEEYLFFISNNDFITPNYEYKIYINGQLLEGDITIPNTITVISDYAFYKAEITSVNIPSSVTEIGKYAFCFSTLNNVVFASDSKLTKIGTHAFSNTNIINFTLPDSVKEIGDYAFYIHKLSQFIINENAKLEKIGSYAFAYTNLYKITIPKSVKEIGDNVFESGRLIEILNLSDVTFNLDIETKTSKIFVVDDFDFIKMNDIFYLLYYNGDADNIILPNTDFNYEIYKFAFSYLDGKSITLSENVTKINMSAIYQSNIERFDISKAANLKEIADSAILYSTINETSLISDVSINIGDDFFNNFINIEVIELPNVNVISKKQEVKNKIKRLIIPDYYDIKIIGLDNLEYLELTNTKDIGENSTYSLRLDNLKTLIINGEISRIYNINFDIPNIEKLILSDNIIEMTNFSFKNLKLDVLNLPKNLTNITNVKINGEIDTVNIYENVKSMIKVSFGNVKNLNFVDINNISQINDSFAYDYYENLDMQIFENVPEFNNNFTQTRFKNLTCSADDISYFRDNKVENLYLVSGIVNSNAYMKVTNLYISKEVEEIVEGYSACNNIYLKSIVVEEGSNLILPESLFDDSDDSILENLSLPIGVTMSDSIMMPNLKALICPSQILDQVYSMTNIVEVTILDGDGSNIEFQSCKNLTKVVLPETITTIVSNAFYNCSNLREINFPSSLTKIGNYVFQGCSFLEEVILPDNINEIGTAAFKDCSSLVNVKLPSNLTTITHSMFSGCSSLEEITLPDRINIIDTLAFSNTSLKELVIPANVNQIGMGIVPEGMTIIFEDPNNWIIELYNKTIPANFTNPVESSAILESKNETIHAITKKVE